MGSTSDNALFTVMIIFGLFALGLEVGPSEAGSGQLL